MLIIWVNVPLQIVRGIFIHDEIIEMHIIHEINYTELNQVFLGHFRDPVWVPRIVNQVPRIRENGLQVPKIRENQVPRIKEIGSLQVHTRYRKFSLKKT